MTQSEDSTNFPAHTDFLFVRTTLDSFEATGPDDRHFCLLYEPLRELLWTFQQHWEDSHRASHELPIELSTELPIELHNTLTTFIARVTSSFISDFIFIVK